MASLEACAPYFTNPADFPANSSTHVGKIPSTSVPSAGRISAARKRATSLENTRSDWRTAQRRSGWIRDRRWDGRRAATRGFAHFRLKQYAEALADFDEAIRLNPSYVNAYVNRSAARRAAGDKAGADADPAKARELMQGGK